MINVIDPILTIVVNDYVALPQITMVENGGVRRLNTLNQIAIGRVAGRYGNNCFEGKNQLFAAYLFANLIVLLFGSMNLIASEFLNHNSFTFLNRFNP